MRRMGTSYAGVSAFDADLTIEGLTIRDTNNSIGLSCNATSAVAPRHFVLLREASLINNNYDNISASKCDVFIEKSSILGDSVSAGEGSLTIDQSTFSGSFISHNFGDLTITRSVFADGSGIQVSGPGSFTITNNFIYRSGSATGANAVSFNAPRSPAIFAFNTLTENVAGPSATAYGLLCTGFAPVFSNNILWNNSGGGVNISGCLLTYSDVQGGAPGAGNLNANPLFVNASASNFHLQAGSPCRNVGDPSGAPSLDFDGDARPMGTGIDIGADETP